jgi:hypothetical protein
MDNDELNKISESIKEKIGEENFAKISDDMGTLITGNTLNLESIKSQEEEISKLKDSNEKLVMANGNLLKQVPMGKEDLSEKEEKESIPKKINLRDAFNKNGSFKH